MRAARFGHAGLAAEQEEAKRPRGVFAEVGNEIGAIEVAGEAAAVQPARGQVHADAVVDDPHRWIGQALTQPLALHDEVGVGKAHQPLLAAGHCGIQRLGEGRLGGREHLEPAQAHPFADCKAVRLHADAGGGRVAAHGDSHRS